MTDWIIKLLQKPDYSSIQNEQSNPVAVTPASCLGGPMFESAPSIYHHHHNAAAAGGAGAAHDHIMQQNL